MPRPDTMRAWRVSRLGEPAEALSLLVDHVVPFERAPEALSALASGATVGRVVVELG
jgi:NADPH:quinone reductase